MAALELVTAGPLFADEVAQLMGVKRSLVDGWRKRNVFPPTDQSADGEPLWDREALLDWGFSTDRIRHGHPRYWGMIAAHAQATRAAQGLPPTIEDEAVYDQLATIIVHAERSRALRPNDLTD